MQWGSLPPGLQLGLYSLGFLPSSTPPGLLGSPEGSRRPLSLGFLLGTLSALGSPAASGQMAAPGWPYTNPRSSLGNWRRRVWPDANMLASWRSLQAFKGPYRPETERPAAKPQSSAVLATPASPHEASCSTVERKPLVQRMVYFTTQCAYERLIGL